MKITRLGPADEIFHRFLTPKWAHLPTSGAGAATDRGRFNRPGMEALYLSRAPQTALEEYRQGASITSPATLAAYTVQLDPIVDLSEGFDPLVWDSKWAGWDCHWRKIARIDLKTPVSCEQEFIACTTWTAHSQPGHPQDAHEVSEESIEIARDFASNCIRAAALSEFAGVTVLLAGAIVPGAFACDA